MSLAKSVPARLVVLLLALVMVAGAPSPSTAEYTYKVARREEIIARGTRTRPHARRASMLPGQSNYAVFENYQFGGVNTNSNDATTQPTFAACAALCTATSDCTHFRWGQTPVSAGYCALRRGALGRASSTDFRSALKGVTCAQAKAMYSDLATATCVEEFY